VCEPEMLSVVTLELPVCSVGAGGSAVLKVLADEAVRIVTDAEALVIRDLEVEPSRDIRRCSVRWRTARVWLQ